MTGLHGREGGGAQVRLSDWPLARLGPVTVPAPHARPRQLDGRHGHLWQWVGDGDPLLSLSVAVRETRLGTATGLRGRLEAELDHARAAMAPAPRPVVEEVEPVVEGVTAVAARLHGVRDGLAVSHAVVVTTDGRLMHVVQVVVTRGDEGAGLVDRVLHGLQVHPWGPPR